MHSYLRHFVEMNSFTLRPLSPEEKASITHCPGGWVALRAGLDPVENRKSLAPAGNGAAIPRVIHPIS
jgi:hypothetical protein